MPVYSNEHGHAGAGDGLDRVAGVITAPQPTGSGNGLLYFLGSFGSFQDAASMYASVNTTQSAWPTCTLDSCLIHR